jgi:hypothetical protein
VKRRRMFGSVGGALIRHYMRTMRLRRLLITGMRGCIAVVEILPSCEEDLKR